jgi:hypothetical protein
MASEPRSLFSDWSLIAAMIDGAATVKNSDIAAALRSATPEIDSLIALLHTPDVMSLLQMREVKPDDEVLEKLFDALESLLFNKLSVVPARVQHYIADLIERPHRPVGRPRRPVSPMQLVQRESREREKAQRDIDEVNDLIARHGSEIAAIKALARARQITVQSARRRYQKSKRCVEKANAEFLELAGLQDGRRADQNAWPWVKSRPAGQET